MRTSTMAACVVLAMAPARASQIAYRPVPLADVLARSTLVVIGKRVKPDDRRGYQVGDEAFAIVEVLKGDARHKGRTILVEPFERAIEASMAAHHAANGGTISPIVDTYESSLSEVRYLGTPRVIVFLICEGDACRFATRRAYEAVTRRAQIVKLLAARAAR